MNTKSKLIALGVVVAVVIVGAFVVRPWFQDRTVPIVVNEKIDRPALNMAFTFPSGESAYSFLEPKIEPAPGGPEAVFILMKAEDYTEFQAVPTEDTPPSMSIFVFPEPADTTPTRATGTLALDRLTRLGNWAEARSALTLYGQAINEPEVVEIDGVKALHYQVKGNYLHEVYVALNRGRYYVLVGQYNKEGDLLHSAFTELVHTFTFY